MPALNPCPEVQRLRSEHSALKSDLIILLSKADSFDRHKAETEETPTKREVIACHDREELTKKTIKLKIDMNERRRRKEEYTEKIRIVRAEADATLWRSNEEHLLSRLDDRERDSKL